MHLELTCRLVCVVVWWSIIARYKSGMSSWLDINVMNPIWTWSANHLVPDWLAPNLITTLSLSHGVATCALLLYYAPNLIGVAPSWVYLSGTWNMWMYQLLDAIDGKQARRMEASSPLGQLFDHGMSDHHHHSTPPPIHYNRFVSGDDKQQDAMQSVALYVNSIHCTALHCIVCVFGADRLPCPVCVWV